MKIDKRKHYYLIIDTETSNGGTPLEPSQCLFYDIGFAVIDRHGIIYEKFSFINADTYITQGSAMETAYYKDKLPQYEKDMYNTQRLMLPLELIQQKTAEIIKKYNIKEVIAHNARFDSLALNSTLRYITKSKKKYFMPYGIIWYDTLKMARDILSNEPSYISFCENNGFLTQKGKPQLKAETIYRFITGNTDFEESHTGLEDVLIETEIFAYLMRQHKPMRKELYPKKEYIDQYGFPLEKIFPKKCKYTLDKLVSM